MKWLAHYEVTVASGKYCNKKRCYFQIDLPYEALKSNPCNEAGRQGRGSEEVL